MIYAILQTILNLLLFVIGLLFVFYMIGTVVESNESNAAKPDDTDDKASDADAKASDADAKASDADANPDDTALESVPANRPTLCQVAQDTLELWNSPHTLLTPGTTEELLRKAKQCTPRLGILFELLCKKILDQRNELLETKSETSVDSSDGLPILTFAEKEKKYHDAESEYKKTIAPKSDATDAEKFNAEKNLEKWHKCMTNDPEYKKKIRQEQTEWENAQKSADHEATLRMGKRVPKKCDRYTTIESIVQHIQSNDESINPEVVIRMAEHIQNNHFLHLWCKSEADIKKMSYRELQTLSSWGCDLTEMRAMKTKLQPGLFTEPDKQLWYNENVVRKYTQYVNKETSLRKTYPSEESWDTFLQSTACPKWLCPPAYRKQPTTAQKPRVVTMKPRSNKPSLSFKKALAAATASRENLTGKESTQVSGKQKNNRGINTDDADEKNRKLSDLRLKLLFRSPRLSDDEKSARQ